MHFPKSQMSHRKLVGCWPCGPPDSIWGLPSLGATNVFTEPALWNKYCFDKSCDIKFLPSRRMQSEASTTLHAWPHPFRGSSSPSPHPKAPVRVKKTHQTGEPTKACKARQIVSSHLDFSKQTHSMEEKKKKVIFLWGAIEKLVKGIVMTLPEPGSSQVEPKSAGSPPSSPVLCALSLPSVTFPAHPTAWAASK